MSHEWGLIARGFAIAGLGAIASMLYIVGLSAIYVGRFSVAAASLAAAVAGAVAFGWFVGGYLDILDERATAGLDSESVNSRGATESGIPAAVEQSKT
jgi:hypothetical protein